MQPFGEKFLPLNRPANPVNSVADAATLFDALSSPVRLGVLLRVLEREWSVNELAADLNISQSALSQHLGKLRKGGVIHARRVRQMVFYRCSHPRIVRLLAEAGLSR